VVAPARGVGKRAAAGFGNGVGRAILCRRRVAGFKEPRREERKTTNFNDARADEVIK
jgi:hypothetical protein